MHNWLVRVSVALAVMGLLADGIVISQTHEGFVTAAGDSVKTAPQDGHWCC